MESTSSAAVVGPKKKSQNPAARAKRLKRLLVNPDFAEAVSGERATAQMWEEAFKSSHRKYVAMGEQYLACQAKVIDSLQLKNDYIEQLKENKELNKAVSSMETSITIQFEMTGAYKRYISKYRTEPSNLTRRQGILTG